MTFRKVNNKQQQSEPCLNLNENEVENTESDITNLPTDNFPENLLASNKSPLGSITNLASSKENYNSSNDKNKWKCDVSFILLLFI